MSSTEPAPPNNGAGFDVEAALSRIAHWLPRQGPIKDFVHHNTLHAFQGMSFHQALGAAARLYGARLGLEPNFFLDAYRAGQISDSALTRALGSVYADETQRVGARAIMLSGRLTARTFSGRVRDGLRACWIERLGGVPLHRRSHLHLFRLFGGYLDQGLSTWRMPGAEEVGFYECIAEQVQRSRLPLLPFDTPGARGLLALSARDALIAALAKTVGREDWYEPYLLETLLTQSGWSGLIAICERNPGLLLKRRRITLLDCVSVTLVAELGCLERELGPSFAPLCTTAGDDISTSTPDASFDPCEEEMLLSAWQEAFEWSYYEPLLGGLKANAARAARKTSSASAWAFFCLDDRSCSVRRHLEEISSSIVTFGTAGFFGLDFFYRGAADVIAGKHCPAPITPRHLIVERFNGSNEAAADPSMPWWRRLIHLESGSDALLPGWFFSYALGFSSAARLAANVLRPSLAPVAVAPLSTVDSSADFDLLRRGDTRSAEGLLLGYSCEELADRVGSVLRSMGADRAWPELVVVFGHGASSVNNPYFSAYNCGACSGRVGAPNARAFAKAANHSDVRRALEAREICIPDSTWFVGALYDTTRDEATYYDVERIPPQYRDALASFQQRFDIALGRNAAERCRRFDSLPLPLSPDRALEEVRLRSMSLFQPRPEYNHATNASCFVGRRAVTAGLFLDRRTFLNSYEPSCDPQGEILTDVLSAVIPVCAGINLEYFFSRIDPVIYGAGTKLPHNVNGLLGVCNGIEGDLLTGLPTQMTEIHDPLRLIVIVEQSPDVALRAVSRDESIFEFVKNDWVRYGCLDPANHEIWMYQRGRMIKVDGLTTPKWAWPTSLDAARQGRGNLPIGFVGPLELAPDSRA